MIWTKKFHRFAIFIFSLSHFFAVIFGSRNHCNDSLNFLLLFLTFCWYLFYFRIYLATWIRNISRRKFFPFSSTGSQVSCDLLSVGGSGGSGFSRKDTVWAGSAGCSNRTYARRGSAVPRKPVIDILRYVKTSVLLEPGQNPNSLQSRMTFRMRSWSWLGLQSMHTFCSLVATFLWDVT
jgi:hypothetical protein